MNRLLIGTAVAVLLGLSQALAADDMTAPATQPGVSQETSKSAHQPSSGSADTSGGAAEQSSAPPSSGAASANKMDKDAMKPSSGSADQSTGAKEQSSAPARLVRCRYVQAQSNAWDRELQGVGKLKLVEGARGRCSQRPLSLVVSRRSARCG